MFLEIEGTKKVKYNSLLAHYIKWLDVKSWCALFVASCGVLAVGLAGLAIVVYGTLVMTGVYYHVDQPVSLMIPSVMIAVAAWLVIGGTLIFHGGKFVGEQLLKFWSWSQHSCSQIEFDYKDHK